MIASNNNHKIIIYVLIAFSIVLSQDTSAYRNTTVSNIQYYQKEDGYSAHTPDGGPGGIYPVNTAPVIYLDGILLGGFQNEQLKVSGSIYRNGLVNGTIQNGQLNQNSSTRIFKIRKNFTSLTEEQLTQEVIQSTGKCDCVVEYQNIGIIAIEEYASWPDSGSLVDGSVDSHLSPSLSQTGMILDNRAGGINLPSYSRDYDRFGYWGFDDVVIDFGDESVTWDYIHEGVHRGDANGDGDSSEVIMTPFAVYRIKFATGDTIRLFAGFWDTNGDGAWSVNYDEADSSYDWVAPTYGAECWEPIYCWQGYDADGNEISYDPANEAQYDADDALSTSANITWGSSTGEFTYPYITATLVSAYYGPNESGSYVEGSPEGGASALPITGNYDKFGVQLESSHYFRFTTSNDSTLYLDSSQLVTNYDRALIYERYLEDWLNWPVHLGAPFYDIDNDGIYEPTEGETPGYADADEVIWYVATDADEITTADLYGSAPIGLELQFTVFSYDQPETGLKESVFKRVRVINKSTNLTSENGDDLTDAYISLWSDPDVGDYTNDLVGVDTSLSMMFSYNGGPDDDDFAEFGLAPPSIGYSFINGPKVQGVSTDTAIVNFKKLPYYKNLSASSFGYFVAGGIYSEPGPYGVTEAAREYYNLMRGFAPTDDLANPTAWVDSYGNPTKFPFAGDPVTGEGDLDSEPADRRMLINAGPFTLAVGDTQDILLSITGGISDNYLSSISQLKENAIAAETYTASLVETLTNPDPDTTVEYITWYAGDTDHNGVVDEYDIISIGMYFHNTTIALDSSGGSFAWSARNSIEGFVNNDILMADVDGNGFVDERDVVGIGIHWGNTYSSSNMMSLWDDLDIYDLSDEKKVKFEKLYHSLIGESEPVLKIRALLKNILGIGIPTDYSLEQNYPNPFNASTIINFSLPRPSQVNISIYNIIGQRVDIPINNINYLPGNYKIKYDAKSLSSGVYFVRINTPEWSSMKKMMLIK